MAAPDPGKTQLRARLRQRRRELSASEQLRASQLLVQHAGALPGWTDAGRIALYRASDGEIDSAPLIDYCLAEGKELFLPVIGKEKCLEFGRWTHGEPLCDNRFGIPEPLPGALRATPAELDILFLPLVGWDRQGNRLGMGGGYYDRLLAGESGPLLVGLAYALQELEQIPAESWDVKLDIVLTEEGVQPCRGY